MFSAINNLNPNAPAYGPFPENLEQGAAEFIRRTKIIKRFVKDLGIRAGIDPVKMEALKIGPHGTFNGAAVTNEDTVVMRVPALFFIDFIRDFEVQDLEEFNRKLNDLEWMETVCNRIGEIFQSTPPEASDYFRDEIRFHVENLMSEPEKAFEASRFCILHEFGHIRNDDVHPKCITALWIGAACVFLVFWPILGMGYLISGASLSLLSGSLVVLIATVAMLATMILLKQLIERSQEIEADRFAAGALPGEAGEAIRRGGIHHFECLKRRQGETESSLFSRFFDPHPPHEERIEMFQTFQQNALPDLRPAIV